MCSDPLYATVDHHGTGHRVPRRIDTIERHRATALLGTWVPSYIVVQLNGALECPAIELHGSI